MKFWRWGERRRREADLERELRNHLDLEAEERQEAGLSSKEAAWAARRALGNTALIKEDVRAAWGFQWLETLLQDLRYGLRQLRRNPGFTAVTILTLALGIGANTAIFTLLDETMLKSLPVQNPNQLYGLGNWQNCCVISGFQNDGWGVFSYSLYQQLRDHTPEFGDLAAFQAGRMHLSVRRQNSSTLAKPLGGEFVSGNYFETFGVGASAGRILTPDDDRANSPPVAMMSYQAWQQDFGGDPSVIGATFDINTVPYTIVGITPKGFFGDALETDPPDFWLPLATEPVLMGQASILNHPEECWLYAIGRLRSGAKPRQVQSQLTAELQQWLNGQGEIPAQYRSEIPKQFIELTPSGKGVARLRDYYADGLRMLTVLAGVVLLIACANIANLLLARGAASRHNTAMRVALGAPRGRLLRQGLTETILLAILGGLAGLYVAYAGVQSILLLAFRGSHYVPLSANPSWAVLGFAFALSLATGVTFGVVPAWMNSRLDPADVLRGVSHSSGDHAPLARRAFVVLQVAMCVALLASAGLLTKSLRNLEHQHFGFAIQHRWIINVNPAIAGYKPDQLYGLYQQLERRLSSIPAVESASYSLAGPVDGGTWSSPIHVEGKARQENAVSWMRIGPRYFETIGTPVIRGRGVSDQDTPTSRRVAVVNQAFARKFFPREDPIGQHFGIGGASHAADFEIVGVVADGRPASAGHSRPTFFLPFFQTVAYHEGSWRSIQLRSNYARAFELHVTGRPDNLGASVRRVFASINPNLTVVNMTSFGQQLSLSFNQDRLMARLTELFALLALALACVGLYGATSYSVAQRTNEIGIRMALGAQKGDILSMVVGQGLKLALMGLTIGIAGALVLTRFLASLLYGVKPTDPLTFIAVSLILIGVALVACYIPARRAAKVDPMVALRYE